MHPLTRLMLWSGVLVGGMMFPFSMCASFTVGVWVWALWLQPRVVWVSVRRLLPLLLMIAIGHGWSIAGEAVFAHEWSPSWSGLWQAVQQGVLLFWVSGAVRVLFFILPRDELLLALLCVFLPLERGLNAVWRGEEIRGISRFAVRVELCLHEVEAWLAHEPPSWRQLKRTLQHSEFAWSGASDVSYKILQSNGFGWIDMLVGGAVFGGGLMLWLM